MSEYIIQPWGTAEQDFEDVPIELTNLAKKVTTHYDMKLISIEMITSKPDKGGAIWRIDTDKGLRSLKVLHRTPERSLFSVGAQEYVVKQGARVPKLIRTKTGKNCIEAGGKLWIVTDWIDLTPADQTTVEGFGMLCYGLGEFHQHSKGYDPPFGSKFSSRLHSYPKQYEKMATKINWFRELARAYPEMPASRMLYLMVDKYERQAIKALERLNTTPYYDLIAKGEQYWGLAHQDYGFSNGQLGPNGVWVIDLDGVSFDLPIRDLRKLVTSSMEDKGAWDVEWMNSMIQAYHQANPISPELFEVFLTDMMLPNEFYKHVKEIIFSPTTLMNEQLEVLLTNIENQDSTKWTTLQQLSKEWKVGGKNIPNWEKFSRENAPAKRFRRLDPVDQTKVTPPENPIQNPESAPETTPVRTPIPRRRRRKMIPRHGSRAPLNRRRRTPLRTPKKPLNKRKRHIGKHPVPKKRTFGTKPIQKKRSIGTKPSPKKKNIRLIEIWLNPLLIRRGVKK
ncbi:CotS family spore coat protein [Shimazuella kribbensis]|uniref:CotS family spore coat protein n=1 Tax=Shimazuella kribbensis TaxID=139808 RepID=UPI0004011073|nr:CotS family spore coat protein [Shimazuella kribbensis]